MRFLICLSIQTFNQYFVRSHFPVSLGKFTGCVWAIHYIHTVSSWDWINIYWSDVFVLIHCVWFPPNMPLLIMAKTSALVSSVQITLFQVSCGVFRCNFQKPKQFCHLVYKKKRLSPVNPCKLAVLFQSWTIVLWLTFTTLDEACRVWYVSLFLPAFQLCPDWQQLFLKGRCWCLRQLWHCVNAHLNAPDQRIDDNYPLSSPVFIEAVMCLYFFTGLHRVVPVFACPTTSSAWALPFCAADSRQLIWSFFQRSFCVWLHL